MSVQPCPFTAGTAEQRRVPIRQVSIAHPALPDDRSVAEVARLRRVEGVFEQLPKKTSPGLHKRASAREFRVILLCPTVLFGAQMAATPSRPADLI